MDDDAYVHLDVALALGGGDTIRGTVDDRNGPPTAFTGWLELMSAFDTARGAPIGGADPPRSGGGA